MIDGRQLPREALPEALAAARRATFASTLDLTDAEWNVPYHPGIQPTAWDLAHIAWFGEFWLLRGPHRIGTDGFVHGDGKAPFVGLDERYDSARIGHRERWQMPLFARDELLDRMAGQLDACQRAVLSGGDSDADLHHAHFVVLHELMHVEALAWTRATLARKAPPGLVMPRMPAPSEVAIEGGEHRIGCPPGTPGFVFDNEAPGRTVHLRPFAIDRTPVTNAAFRAFVEADGYRRAAFWPGRAATWLARHGLPHPERWRRAADGGWQQRWFDQWVPLAAEEPVVHVSAHEAEAWCLFAGRRLPTAAEWEVAAERITWGRSVWEWTSDPFAPHPGFRPGPYTTYSAPWFHHQREMRGGAFATHPLMHDRRYRNFFLPYRTDVFAGFRSARD